MPSCCWYLLVVMPTPLLTLVAFVSACVCIVYVLYVIGHHHHHQRMLPVKPNLFVPYSQYTFTYFHTRVCLLCACCMSYGPILSIKRQRKSTPPPPPPPPPPLPLSNQGKNCLYVRSNNNYRERERREMRQNLALLVFVCACGFEFDCSTNWWKSESASSRHTV